MRRHHFCGDPNPRNGANVKIWGHGIPEAGKSNGKRLCGAKGPFLCLISGPSFRRIESFAQLLG